MFFEKYKNFNSSQAQSQTQANFILSKPQIKHQLPVSQFPRNFLLIQEICETNKKSQLKSEDKEL
jgi:hypothetical protein